MNLGNLVTALEFWRGLEAYTPTVNIQLDNNAAYVVLLDITGRGFLASFGWSTETADVTWRITIDGVIVINGVQMNKANNDAPSITSMWAFATDCKVEVKGGAAAEFRAWAMANVE